MHYINYGTAKTASTWLFNTLGFVGVKEPSLRLVENKDKYLDYFKKQNVNFNPNLWQLDSSQLKFLSNMATHQTIIFRDPYTYADSLYNFWTRTPDLEDFVFMFRQYFDYAKILKRLSNKTMVIYYDDIKNNPQVVLDNLTKFLEIPNVTASTTYVNKTNYKQHLSFSRKDSIMLNEFIKNFEDSVQTDLSHWKKNV
jgi:hypothetical protein